MLDGSNCKQENINSLLHGIALLEGGELDGRRLIGGWQSLNQPRQLGWGGG